MQANPTLIQSKVSAQSSKISQLTAFKPFFVLLGIFLSFSEAKAQVPIVYYDFEDYSLGYLTGQTSRELEMAGVNASPVVRVGGTIAPQPGAGIALSGGVTNATAGLGLSSANWSMPQNDPGTSATEYYQFNFSTSGLADLAIDMDIKSSVDGPERWGMLYSFDNITYYLIGFTSGFKNVSTSYQRLVMNFSGAAVFNNKPVIYFRIYAYKPPQGASTAGTFQIDNLIIHAKTITASKTLLNEAHIYTCMTSGATGGMATRAGLKVSGTGTVATMSSGLILENSLELDGGTLELGAYNLTLNCPTITGTTAETGIITTSASGITIGGGSKTYLLKEMINGVEVETTVLLPALKLPANITQLNNLTIYRTNGGSLDNNLLLNGTLTLTSGKLTSTTAKKLTIGKNGTVSGGNATSFVNGPVGNIIADGLTPVSKVFPVGKGAAYRPVTLTVTQDQILDTEYPIEQFEGSHTYLPIPAEQDLSHVSAIRYFSINKGAGANFSNGKISLSYDIDDEVTDPTNLRIAKTNSGTSWLDLGRDASSSPGNTGTITSTIPFSSFSNFLLANAKGGGNTLPVELASFNAAKKGADVILDWTTASEKDNKGFDVQVSADGNEFRNLGFVASKNSNATATQAYQFIDKEISKTNTRYYRLKQTDLDGTVTYSAIKAVSFQKNTVQTAVFPNPFGEQLTLQIAGKTEQSATVEITDALGKVVYGQELSLQQGHNQTTLQLPVSLTTGIYTLALKTSEGIKYHKIIKKIK